MRVDKVKLDSSRKSETKIPWTKILAHLCFVCLENETFEEILLTKLLDLQDLRLIHQLSCLRFNKGIINT
jgi:hypothetical protein